MTVKPNVAVRKRSVCDLVRLAVRPVNSDFDIFIRILPYLATVCFFLCFSLHGWEKSMRERDKKQKTSKKKTLSAAVTASPASSTLRWQRFLDVLMINHQANVALFGTSQSMLHQSWANLPRRMWSFFLSLPHFPRQIFIFVSPSTRQRSYTTAVSACNQKAKEKRKPPCAWRIVLYLKRTAAQNVAFCVFSRVFFSRVGKNQWARVTRNKEKTCRGLT